MMRKFTFFLLLILTTVYAWADKKAPPTGKSRCRARKSRSTKG